MSEVNKDKIKVELYNKFFNDNGDLYKFDAIKYWRDAKRFVESRLQKLLNTTTTTTRYGKRVC